MVTGQPPEGIMVIKATNAASIALNASETPAFYRQLQHQGNSINGVIIIFYTNQIHGGIISRLFFIHFVAPCACSSSSG